MCECIVIGRGVQLFRIQEPGKWFEKVADLGPLHSEFMEDRQAWKCRGCGALFALMRIFYKDAEDILVRARASDWQSWDWHYLGEVADSCRWHGPQWEKRHVL